MIAWIRLPPFIVTLGLFNVATAVALLSSHETTIVNLPAALLFLGGRFMFLGTPWSVGALVMLGGTTAPASRR